MKEKSKKWGEVNVIQECSLYSKMAKKILLETKINLFCKISIIREMSPAYPNFRNYYSR